MPAGAGHKRSAAGSATNLNAPSSRLVLVVDDDQDIRDALCELLVEEGYRAVPAKNGEDALTYLGSGELPSVILLDLMMPVMDGWEFRRRQQNDPGVRGIPVVVITAAGELRAQSIAVERVLAKPLQIDEVLEVLKKYA
jgi:CheY-like chemotaxis protein